MFNITNVSGAGVSLTGLFETIRTDPGQPTEFEVWTRFGGYQGFELSSEGWTQLGSTQTIGAADAEVTTSFNVGQSLRLEAGQIVGIYFYSPGGIQYTNTGDSGALSTYNDSVLQLDLGVGVGMGRFSGSVRSDRTANVSIDYAVDPVPEPSTALLLMGGMAGVLIARSRSKKAA